MTVIRVVPDSVRSYGNSAQNIFNTMHESLVGLVNDVVAVRYFGPNAVSFKTECGTVAADFANRLHADMAAMADAVKQSTSNIAASLGGAPIVIQIDPKTITPPQPQSVDYVDVDTSALGAMTGAVNKWFAALDSGLSSNLSGLQSTDWEGNAKIAAVDSVTGFTSSARTRCETTKQTIVNYINRQVEAAQSADK